jgi:DNA topoisomerase-1
MSKLVIVESPAKAKTIGRFLGSGYDVQASFGHVRDLPESATDIPAEFKKQKWAKLGVNIDADFEPLYIIPDDKKRHVDNLKKASKGISELLLATDEDREGESISWHILQVLKLNKNVKVSRIVFHEVTQEAIAEAIRNPRALDEGLVRAQETRRILDRLVGYSLSPLLWKKVAPKLSAGRVQSVAVRLTVQRERERMKFKSAEYWDLVAKLAPNKDVPFTAKLVKVSDQRIASGKSFNAETGLLDDKSLHVTAGTAEELLAAAKVSKPWLVSALDTKPGMETPPKPFMTSTLQQEANRKLRFTSRRTMQIAQNLYEGIDLGGERVGLITYMRTDSLSLGEKAVAQAREVIRDLYGPEYVPAKPVIYKTKAKGAQEAHEAIRPTDLARTPQSVKNYLSKEQFDLYELIWKRTIACQMMAAQLLRTTVEVETIAESKSLKFNASGRQITFPGFLRAYVEGSDDPDSELESKESVLPTLNVGMDLNLMQLDAAEHHTAPPARYTEASLVGKLESEGVGRPSTYASILGTIQDRGYVFKRGNELIPTFTAFAVTELLENNFEDLVDLEFTAKMENQLDEIADGERDWVKHLRGFYVGENSDGLASQIEAKSDSIPYPALLLGEDPASDEPIVVRVGRYGTFVQRGEGGTGNTGNVPEDMPPADLTLERAIELIVQKGAGPTSLGEDPATGRKVFLKAGRFGAYLEVEQTPGEIEVGDKPKRISLPPGMKASDVTADDVPLLVRFPRELGNDPKLGEPVVVLIGRYGPFVKCGEEIRNIPDWRIAADVTLEEASEILAQPKVSGRPGRGPTTPVEPIKKFGTLEGAQGEVKVLSGRYGPYVTDGNTNATIPKDISPEEITADQAMDLIKARVAAGPSKKKPVKRGFAKSAPKTTSKVIKAKPKTAKAKPKK